MSKISKAQRDRVVLIAALTVFAGLLLWQLRSMEAATLGRKQGSLRDARETIANGMRQCALTNQLQGDLEVAQERLGRAESRMVTGDVYRWVIKTLVEFYAAERIDFAHFEPPDVVEHPVLPRLPYKAAVFRVSGSAYYHDFGIFLAAIESTYPHMRIMRLDLNAKASGDSTTPQDEKLAFRMEFICLVRPNIGAGTNAPAETVLSQSFP